MNFIPSSPVDTFDIAQQEARKLLDTERCGNLERIQKLDFSLGPTCIRCSMPCIDARTREWKPFQCGGCRAVIYCGRDCQRADWKQNIQPRALSHKELCAKNKEYMERIPYFRAVFQQFPWARIESDGTFAVDIFKAARLKLLGADPSFGYWSVPGGMRPHDSGGINSPWEKAFKRSKTYIHGEVLLGNEWPMDTEAWKLPNENQIPHLFFSDEFPPPSKVQPGQVKDWASWYEWRGLTMDSPAALLMDYSLSVYYLLTDVLNVVDANGNSHKRQQLQVHYIGAEVELNYLPLFSELALLLPNVDITLVIFGGAGRDLVQKAKREYPGSLATNDIVWSYSAPKRCGGGSIAIKIDSTSENWSRDTLSPPNLPDAMIGCNAGLLAYKDWGDPMIYSAFFEIPFGVTEYAEQSMDQCAKELPKMRSSYATSFPPGSAEWKTITRSREHPVTVNPFHRPGQRK